MTWREFAMAAPFVVVTATLIALPIIRWASAECSDPGGEPETEIPEDERK